MRSIQEIFSGRFRNCAQAAIQRCDETDANQIGLKAGYTEHWPGLRVGTDLIALAIGDGCSRDIWCGQLVDELPSLKYPKLKRFIVDRFDLVGTHDLQLVSDADFYGNHGGGGSRVIHINTHKVPRLSPTPNGGIVGANERREVWVRKNHRKFRDPVYAYWEGACALLGHDCNGLLVASHIKPWHLSDKIEKVDPNNGLLLSVAIDRLFDVGLIGFSSSGNIVLSRTLKPSTMRAFGVTSTMAIQTKKITAAMRLYLRWHREHFGL
jgi:hypothetical protein